MCICLLKYSFHFLFYFLSLHTLCIHVGQHQAYKYKIVSKTSSKKCLCCWWGFTHTCERLKTNANTNTDMYKYRYRVIQIVFSQMLQRLKSQGNLSTSPWMLYPAAGLSGEHKIKTSSLMPISSELDKGTSLVLFQSNFVSQEFSESNKGSHYSDQILLTKN